MTLALGDSLVQGEGCVLAFGASQVQGFSGNWGLMHPFTDQLEARLRAAGVARPVLNYGMCGEKAVVMHKRLDEVLESLGETPIALSLFLGGTNDLGGAGPADRHDPDVLADVIFDGLRKLYDRMLAAGSLVVAMGIFEHGAERDAPYAYIAEARQQIIEKQKAYCEEHADAYFFDLAAAYPFFSIPDDERRAFWADLIHPTAKGYDLIGDALFAFLEEAGIVEKLKAAKDT